MASRQTAPHFSAWLVGNWKAWPSSVREVRRTMARFAKISFPHARGLTFALAPPAPFLPVVRELLPARWKLAAQDGGLPVSEAEATGLFSFAMLKSLGVRLIIVGHSEVRARGVDAETIAQQVATALGQRCEVVLCVGEVQRDGNHFAFVRDQVLSAVAQVRREQLSLLRVAYEPVWAIGSRARAIPEPSQAHEMALWIKKTLAERYGSSAALSVPILYGGSVKPENAYAFARDGGIDGFLVGRASREARQFGEIAAALVAGVSDRPQRSDV